tara:strand:- start:7132 stop:7674 length:543 start_codon:yes stop_codon:yes gene_type:complete
MSKKPLSKISGLKSFKRPVFNSNLGIFSETYKKEWFKNKFVQDSISISEKKGTIRGMHFQNGKFSQAKLITVFKGAIQDVFIDLRKDSSTFCHYGALKISEDNNNVLLLPRGFAHGFVTLESNTIVSYKMDNIYSPENEITLRWDDPDISISWPKNLSYTLSSKDKDGISLKEFLLINKF